VSVSLNLCDKGDYSVPAATATSSKTSFVEEFLEQNPQANVKAVNEAWEAAGMDGTIGDTLIYKVRSEMRLTGNHRAKPKPKTATKAKAGTNMARTKSAPGKKMFVKEFLNDHPQGNVDAVNDAWLAAGFDGTISKTVVDKMRASLGLTGNLRGSNPKSKPSVTGKKPGRPRKETPAAVSVPSQRSNGARTPVLDDLEADIDRLIFKAMAVGDLAEIEDSLRQTRRLLYGALIRG
jgi:hypothetical protein